MACSNPTQDSKGILVAADANDRGKRPLTAGSPFWVSPNVRLALAADAKALQDPAAWDSAPFAGWNGQVVVGSEYNLLVRLRNTDQELQRIRLRLQGWVCDYTAGGVGPGSAIRQHPGQKAGPANPQVAFTAFNQGPLKAGGNDLNNPANMLVLVSDETWTPNPEQLAVNGGHVCVAVNTFGTVSDQVLSPDGGPLTDIYVDPTCNRMFGQRNIQIVAVPQGGNIVTGLTMLVPVTDRCRLRGVILKQVVELPANQDGVLQNVPEFAAVAAEHGIEILRRPDGDPLHRITISNGQHHDDGGQDDGFRVNLDPGERADLNVNVDGRDQRPGDAYAIDLTTTDTATNQLFGAARIYVLVTG